MMTVKKASGKKNKRAVREREAISDEGEKMARERVASEEKKIKINKKE